MAITNRVTAYTRYAVGYSYAREVSATPKCILSDACYAAVIGNDAGLTACYKSFACGFYNAVSATVIFCVSAFYIQTREAIASPKRSCSNARYALRYRYTREAIATLKGILSYARYAASYRYTREALATLNRSRSNIRYTVGNRYTREAIATAERLLSNARYRKTFVRAWYNNIRVRIAVYIC